MGNIAFVLLAVPAAIFLVIGFFPAQVGMAADMAGHEWFARIVGCVLIGLAFRLRSLAQESGKPKREDDGRKF